MAAYKAFADAIARILEAAIPAYDKTIRFQPIQRRAKDADSLRKKIDGRNSDPLGTDKVDPESIEEGIKDLAGIRVVFYTNGDESRFHRSSIIHENFDVDVSRTKIHHPNPDHGEDANEFRSTNIVVSLKESRLALPDFAQFKGMRCEIQIQTILNHAWSETAHDITYKGVKIEGHGNRELKKLRQQLNKIMRERLEPAGREFQQVWDSYQRLLAGKAIIDSDAINKLVTLTNNNDRMDLLKDVGEQLLGDLDDYERQYPDIRAKLTDSAVAAFSTPVLSRDYLGTPYDGVTAEQYLEKVLEYLSQYRYADFKGTLDDAFRLYERAPTDKMKHLVAKFAEGLAQHNRDVWEKYRSPVTEAIVSDKLQSLSSSQALALRGLVLALAEALLSAEIEGTSGNYKSITIYRGLVPPSNTMRKIRRDVLELLTVLYKAANGENQKREVLQAMNRVMQLPYDSAYSDDLMRDAISDGAFVALFYASIAKDEQYEILQTLEHDLLWWHRWTSDVRPPKYAREDILKAKSALDAAISAFRKEIDSNEGFWIHKTLVGYESTFPPMWEKDDAKFDVSDIDKYRKALIEGFVDKITPETADFWFGVIKRCLQTVSNDGATFMHFGPFLAMIGERNPDVAIDYISRLKQGERTERAASALLIGLSRSASSATVNEIVEKWLSADAFLSEIAWFYRGARTINLDHLAILMGKAINRDDLDLILAVFLVSFNTGKENTAVVEKSILEPALKWFVEKKNAAWVNSIWYMPNETWLLPHLGKETYELMLESMQFLPRIEHHAERVLSTIGRKYPALVVSLFDTRLTIAGDEVDFADKYDAVPYSLGKLTPTLQLAPDEVIRVVRNHYAEKGYARKHRALRLLHNVFPDFSVTLVAHLKSLIATKNHDDLIYVAFVLREYEGNPLIDEIAKDLVEALPQGDNLLTDVRIAIESTGVVSGEFGFVQVYKDRKARIAKWLDDPRPKVRSFAADFMHRLDNDIAAEQKRAEDDIASMKAKFGDGEQDDKDDEDDMPDDPEPVV